MYEVNIRQVCFIVIDQEQTFLLLSQTKTKDTWYIFIYVKEMHPVSFRIISPVCMCICICIQSITMAILICDGGPQIAGCSYVQAFCETIWVRGQMRDL